MSNGLDIGTLTGRIELEDRLTNVLEQVGGALGKFEGGFKSAGATILETATGFLTAEAAIAAVEGAFKLGIATLKELTIEGAAVADVEENFNHLTESAGRLGSTLLNELREGTHNTIDDFTLMKLANADLAAGLKLSDEQFRIMADGAFALAQATGVEVTQALESMNDALLKGQARGVQALTGRIDMVKAEEQFAASLKTTADRLTVEEKLQADRKAILDAVAAATGRLGEQTDGLDEKIAQASASWSNFQDNLGKTIATSPVLLEGLDAIRDELVAAFGGKQEDLIQAIAKAINDTAIAATDFVQIVVDGIGIAGVQWNAFQNVLEMSVQGFRAITFVVEEVLLGMMKIANFVSGGALFGDAIAATTADLDRLYNEMLEGEQRIAANKKAQDDWAVSTGRVNEALERIKTRMQAAAGATQENNQVTEEGVDAHTRAAGATNANANAVGALGDQTRRTAEEVKKYNAAWESINAVGKTAAATIAQLSGEVVEAVKYYLDAGVSLEKLKIAYQLTDEQAKAIHDTWVKGNEAIKEQAKATKEMADAWANINALGGNHESILKGVGDKVRDAVIQYSKMGATVKDLAHAYGLTEAQIKAIIAVHEKEAVATDKQTAAYERQNKLLEKTQQMVTTLSGEYITLAEAKERQAAGGSFEINRGNLERMLTQFGIPVMLGFELAKKGFSFQEILEAYRANMVREWVPRGPRIPGFREGGVGDFGEGTLSMLHGKEAIIPLDKFGRDGGFGNTTLHFYVNGTAEESARKISDIIMRQLKQRKQFGAA